ncbi:hypothetical protein PoB_001583600 [Plakobranchus ocellatus]|uniref:Uncharacterized protein n=1 Tax=Plakobranchus ocellatus TaxID=259542 RepID=A0AAV3YQA0_9GAST|nr:hypothetical protein PoB_001583600 [Plakobranchus ocellatus]
MKKAVESDESTQVEQHLISTGCSGSGALRSLRGIPLQDGRHGLSSHNHNKLCNMISMISSSYRTRPEICSTRRFCPGFDSTPLM